MNESSYSLNSLTADTNNKPDEHSNLLEQNHILQSRLSSLETQRDEMLHELQSYQSKLGTIESLEKTSDQLKQKFDEDSQFYEQNVRALKSELRKSVKSSKEAEILQSMVEELHSSKQKLENTLKTAQKDMSKIANENKSLSQTIQELYSQLSKFIEVNKTLKTSYDKQIRESNERIKRLKDEKKDLNSKIDELRTKNISRETVAYGAIVNEMKKSLNNLNQESSQLSEETDRLKKENARLEAQAQKVNDERLVLESKLADQCEEIEHLKQQIAIGNGEEKKMKSLNSSLGLSSGKIDELQKTIESLTLEIREKDAKIARYEKPNGNSQSAPGRVNALKSLWETASSAVSSPNRSRSQSVRVKRENESNMVLANSSFENFMGMRSKEDLNGEISSIKAQNEQLKTTNQELVVKNNEINEKYKIIQSQLSHISKQKEAISEKLHAAENSLEKVTAEKDTISQEINQTMKKSSEIHSRIFNEKNELHDQNKHLTTELKALQAKFQEFKEIQNRLTQDKESLHLKLNSANLELESLRLEKMKNSLIERELELSIVKNTQNKTSTSEKKLQEMLQFVESEKEALLKHNREIEIEKETINQNLTRLSAELQKKSEELMAAESDLNSKNAKNQELSLKLKQTAEINSTEKSKHQELVDSLKLSNSSLSNEIQQLKKIQNEKNSYENQRITALLDDVQALKIERDGLSKTSNALKSQNDRLDKQVEEYKSLISTIQQQLDSLKSENEKIKNDLSQTSGQKELIEKELNAKSSSLFELRSSTNQNETKILELSNQVDELKKLNDSLSLEKVQLVKKLEVLNAELLELKGHSQRLEKVEISRVELEKRLNSQNLTIQNYIKELEISKITNESISIQLKKGIDEKEVLLQELKRSKELSLVEKDASVATIRLASSHRIKELESALEESVKNMDLLSKEKARLEIELSEKKGSLEVAQKEHITCKTKYNQLQELKDTLSQVISNADALLINLEKDVVKLPSMLLSGKIEASNPGVGRLFEKVLQEYKKLEKVQSGNIDYENTKYSKGEVHFIDSKSIKNQMHNVIQCFETHIQTELTSLTSLTNQINQFQTSEELKKELQALISTHKFFRDSEIRKDRNSIADAQKLLNQDVNLAVTTENLVITPSIDSPSTAVLEFPDSLSFRTDEKSALKKANHISSKASFI